MHIPDADTFMALLLEILQLHPEGVSEYDLLQHLRGDTRSGFETARSTGSEDLFRTHFLGSSAQRDGRGQHLTPQSADTQAEQFFFNG